MFSDNEDVKVLANESLMLSLVDAAHESSKPGPRGRSKRQIKRELEDHRLEKRKNPRPMVADGAGRYAKQGHNGQEKREMQ